jgi:hypothetical protein
MGWIGSNVKVPASPELVALRWMVRIFFVAFALIRLFSALGVQISLASEISVLLGGVLIIAHMAATVIGTTRRNAAPNELPAERAAWAIERLRLARGAESAALPTPTALHGDLPAGAWCMSWALGGALAAAALMAAATFPAWPRIGIAGVLILEMSAALIGGYFGYMTGRLTATLRKAWTEATAEGSSTGSH